MGVRNLYLQSRLALSFRPLASLSRITIPIDTMHLLLTLLLSFGLLAGPSGNDEPKARQGLYALTNARIETVTNGTIERGTIVVDGDRIVAIGADVAIPAGAEVIDCDGMTIYPGFIDSGTQLGLAEVGSLPETRDFAEIGDLTPHMQVLTAVNPNSVAIPVTRVNGVTTVITEPAGGMLPGTAALINLHGYTPEQMNVGGARFVVLNFPSKPSTTPSRWDRRSPEERKKQYDDALAKLDETFDRAVLHARIDSAYTANPAGAERPAYAPAMDALVPVLRGEQALLVKVDAARDILAALDWVEARGLTKVVFSGVREGWRVADRIAAAGIPCLVGPVLALPARGSDRYDKAYANPGLLRDAGVTVAIRSGETENTRNLPYHTGFAAAFGLGRADALRAVTIAPAQIFGVADEMGSLEVGKKATLFVADGDAFEPSTQVAHLFIDGWKVPLESRHTELYDEFLNRTPGLETQPTIVPSTN